MEPYSVWSFERSIRDSGNDAFPDRIAIFARAILQGNEAEICERAGELGVRSHPIPLLPDRVQISREPIGAPTRRAARSRTIVQMFIRDHYVCRYCGTRVIDARVLDAIAAASGRYGPLFPRHPHWRIADTHPAFWWQYGTNDHVEPRARGGSADSLDNLVTACWPCQHRKRDFTLADIGWSLRPIAPGEPATGSSLSEWDGLLELLPGLTDLIARTLPPRRS